MSKFGRPKLSDLAMWSRSETGSCEAFGRKRTVEKGFGEGGGNM